MLYTRKGDDGTTKLFSCALGIISIFILIFGSGFLCVQKEKEEERIIKKIVQNTQNQIHITPPISNPGKKSPRINHILHIKIQNDIRSLSFTPGETLYTILTSKENIPLFSLQGKNYPGLGFFVTDIGPLHQGSGKYLMYYVNGKETSVGISNFVPQEGDSIEWKLK